MYQILPDSVQLSIFPSLLRVCSFEGMNFEAFSRVEGKISALKSESLSEIEGQRI
jgi:hypothetical protein